MKSGGNEVSTCGKPFVNCRAVTLNIDIIVVQMSSFKCRFHKWTWGKEWAFLSVCAELQWHYYKNRFRIKDSRKMEGFKVEKKEGIPWWSRG